MAKDPAYNVIDVSSLLHAGIDDLHCLLCINDIVQEDTLLYTKEEQDLINTEIIIVTNLIKNKYGKN